MTYKIIFFREVSAKVRWLLNKASEIVTVVLMVGKRAEYTEEEAADVVCSRLYWLRKFGGENLQDLSRNRICVCQQSLYVSVSIEIFLRLLLDTFIGHYFGEKIGYCFFFVTNSILQL